jgi:hypothetical protein
MRQSLARRYSSAVTLIADTLQSAAVFATTLNAVVTVLQEFPEQSSPSDELGLRWRK